MGHNTGVYSHFKGYKVDIAEVGGGVKNIRLFMNRPSQFTFVSAGLREGDQVFKKIDSSGNEVAEYVFERDHVDITVK